MNNQEANGLLNTRTATGKSLRLIALTGIVVTLGVTAFTLLLAP